MIRPRLINVLATSVLLVWIFAFVFARKDQRRALDLRRESSAESRGSQAHAQAGREPVEGFEETKLLVQDNPVAYKHFGQVVGNSANNVVIGTNESSIYYFSGQGSNRYENTVGASWYSVDVGTNIVAATVKAFETFSVSVYEIVDGEWSDGITLSSGSVKWIYKVGVYDDSLVFVGDPSAGNEAGVVRVFRSSSNGSWYEAQTLNASVSGALGFAVAFDGEYLAVSALTASMLGESQVGAVVIYRRSGSEYFEHSIIGSLAPNFDEYFAFSVAIYGAWVAVGAPYNQDNGQDSGTVYLYYNSGTQFEFQDKVQGRVGTLLGYTVGMSGNLLVVGAPRESLAYIYSGAISVFVNNGMSWSLLGVQGASDSQQGDYYGTSLAFQGNVLVVGAPFRSENGVTEIGAAYKYAINGFSPEPSETPVVLVTASPSPPIVSVTASPSPPIVSVTASPSPPIVSVTTSPSFDVTATPTASFQPDSVTPSANPSFSSDPSESSTITAKPSTETKSGGLSLGAIIGIAVGGVAIMAVAGLAVFFIIRKNRSDEAPESPGAPGEERDEHDEEAAMYGQAVDRAEPGRRSNVSEHTIPEFAPDAEPDEVRIPRSFTPQLQGTDQTAHSDRGNPAFRVNPDGTISFF